MLGRALIDIIVSSLQEFDRIECTVSGDALSIWRMDDNPMYFCNDLRRYRDNFLLLQVGVEADSDFSPIRGTTTLWVEFTPNGAWGDDSHFVYIGSIDDPTFRIEQVIEIVRDTIRTATDDKD